MGWDEYSPTGHVVSCKRLGDERLHTSLGMVGYCMKVDGEKLFEFVHHDVSVDDMDDGNGVCKIWEGLMI